MMGWPEQWMGPPEPGRISRRDLWALLERWETMPIRAHVHVVHPAAQGWTRCAECLGMIYVSRYDTGTSAREVTSISLVYTADDPVLLAAWCPVCDAHLTPLFTRCACGAFMLPAQLEAEMV